MELRPLHDRVLIRRLEEGESKQGSIEGHIFPWDFWASRWSNWVLLGDWKYNAYESWWQAAMVNFGLVWFIAYLALVTGLMIILYRQYAEANPRCKPVYAGLLLYGLYFLVGSLNLPFPIIFPINALFFLFFLLVAFGKVTAGEPSFASHSEPHASRMLKATSE